MSGSANSPTTTLLEHQQGVFEATYRLHQLNSLRVNSLKQSTHDTRFANYIHQLLKGGAKVCTAGLKPEVKALLLELLHSDGCSLLCPRQHHCWQLRNPLLLAGDETVQGPKGNSDLDDERGEVSYPTNVERYVGVTGRIQLNVLISEAVIDSNGQPKMTYHNSKKDEGYKLCVHCNLWFRLTDLYRHRDPLGYISTHPDIPTLPRCKLLGDEPEYVDVPLNKAIWHNGQFRTLMRRVKVIKEVPMPGFKPEDKEDLSTDVDDLENELKPSTTVSDTESQETIDTDMVRIAVDRTASYGNTLWFFEYKGVRRYITLEESYQSDFFPWKDRFTTNRDATEHHIAHNGEMVANIFVSRTGRIERAYCPTGGITEFFLPRDHDFFNYVKTEVMAKELFNV